MKFITRHYWPRLCFLILLCSLSACVPHETALSSFPKSNPAVHPASFSFFKGFGTRKTSRRPIKSPDTYVVRGQKYTTLKSARGYKARGLASWYSAGLHNQRTSSGERYNMHALTAAHRTLPLQTYLQVKNLKNGRTVVVRVNDRGPFHSSRVVDLSYAAAKQLGLFPAGTVMVEIQTITPGFFQNRRAVQPKPGVKPITKARPKPNAGVRPRPAIIAKPVVKPKIKAQAVPQQKHKPKVLGKLKPRVKRKIVAKAKPTIKPKPKVASKPVTKAKPKVTIKPKLKVGSKPTTKARPKVIVKPHPRVISKPVQKAKPKGSALSKPKAKIKPKSNPKTQPKVIN